MSIFYHKPHPGHTHKTHEMLERLSNIGHDPYIDWVLILITATILTAVLVVAGFFAYTRVGFILSQPSANPPSSSAKIDPAMLTHVLGQFAERARERNDLAKNYQGPADPSL
jgi:hypothetical protein